MLTARLLIALAVGGLLLRAPEYQASTFASQIAALSERAGYFDTDNLISNEQGYQQVLGAMNRLGVKGGAYIGVGPDQNYTYIARIRPRIAIIADIRRDNMLLHLLFKAIFAVAERTGGDASLPLDGHV